ncbi:Mitochondrial inner membrane translocase subunit Tim17/Tim22/Tim23/peroxisomal protein PMP24 [Phaffia rhodozyma]|uniref:Mitochondrial inner membrane translocase subunit Tim17/Tim22/Tim23/peroxisomal protein PMP24 n=1 Tax=Phaffia rhodozyma TaxID=264483 RepID=A0A0F7SX39_PHARH|nr:Mitochondrial inner membrane translocase subunit Tim17/Tim22/Tim23/peroxisomal protein PMP24 [Phaffia rhodozyma]
MPSIYTTSISPSLFPIKSISEVEPTFKPHYIFEDSFHALLVGGSLGVVFASVANAYNKHNQGPLGVFTRYGYTIGLMTLVGPTFLAAQGLSANLREKDTPLNAAIGGCAAGFLVGVKSGSLNKAAASCATFALLTGALDYTGGLTNPEQMTEDPIQKKNRIESHLVPRKKLADIHPPPGQGYSAEAYPGYPHNYASLRTQL